MLGLLVGPQRVSVQTLARFDDCSELQNFTATAVDIIEAVAMKLAVRDTRHLINLN
jgi:hypothetical protein